MAAEASAPGAAAPAPAPVPAKTKNYKGFVAGIFSGIAKLSGAFYTVQRRRMPSNIAPHA